MVVLAELNKLLSQEVKSLCSEFTTVQSEWTVPETMNVSESRVFL